MEYLLRDLLCKTAWRYCATSNAFAKSKQLNGTFENTDGIGMELAVAYGEEALAFAGISDEDREKFHWEMDMAFYNRALWKEERREYMQMLKLYGRAAEEMDYVTVMRPSNTRASEMLAQLEHKFGARMKDECGILEVFDPAADIRWKGD